MTSFDDRHLAKYVASAAMLRIPLEEAREAYVTERLGAKTSPPVVTPPNDSADRQALAAAEQQLTAHLPSQFLYIALACLFIVEAIGCALLMANVGFENPSRTVFGIMCAASIFLLTYVAARLGKTSTAGGGANATRTPRLFYVVLVVYAVIVLAITVLRVNEMPGTEEGSRVYDFAAAIIMMGATIGPAWLAEVIAQRLLPMVPLIRTRALHRQRITEMQREHARAVADARVAILRAETWERDAEQLRATYETRYRFIARVVQEALKGGTTSRVPSSVSDSKGILPSRIRVVAVPGKKGGI